MSTYNRTVSNGVSMGAVITVVAADAMAGLVLIDFTAVDYNLAAIVQVVSSINEHVDLGDAVITYPAVGQVQIASGNSTFTITAGYKISVIAQRRTTS